MSTQQRATVTWRKAFRWQRTWKSTWSLHHTHTHIHPTPQKILSFNSSRSDPESNYLQTPVDSGGGLRGVRLEPVGGACITCFNPPARLHVHWGQGLWQRHLSTLQNAEVALETQQLLLILLLPPIIITKSLPSLLASPVTHTISTVYLFPQSFLREFSLAQTGPFPAQQLGLKTGARVRGPGLLSAAESVAGDPSQRCSQPPKLFSLSIQSGG